MTAPRTPLLVAVVLGLAAVAAARSLIAPWQAGAPEDTEPFRSLSLEEARKAAHEEQKLLLLAFYRPSCRPCDAMDKITFLDPKVRAWLVEHTIALRLGAEQAGLAETYSVTRPPTFVLAEPDGEEIDRIAGYQDPGQFLEAAEGIRTATSELASVRKALLEQPEDPTLRLRYAKALKARQRAREASEQFLWVFDHTRGDPTWTEVRLGEVLRELGFYKRTMSELQRELVARRDRAAATLLEGWDPEAPQAELLLCARELEQLNANVGQPGHTLFAWDVVRERENFPKEVLDVLFNEGTQSMLLQEKRYAHLLWGLGDPIVILERRLSELQARKSEADDVKRQPRLSSDRNLLLAEAGRYYQVLLGAGREGEAADLVELLLAIEPCAQAYISLATGAKQAERADLAHSLSERGLSALAPGPERERLRKVTRTLLREDR